MEVAGEKILSFKERVGREETCRLCPNHMISYLPYLKVIKNVDSSMGDIGFSQHMANESQSAQILQDPCSREHAGIFRNSFHGADRGKYASEYLWERQVQTTNWTEALCAFAESSRSWLTDSCSLSLQVAKSLVS